MGDSAILIRLGERIDASTHRRVRALCARLAEQPPPGLVECGPAYASVAVIYDPAAVGAAGAEGGLSPCQRMLGRLERLLADLDEQPLPEDRRVEIPVCYGGDFGPDLEFVARQSGLSPAEVVDLHVAGEYRVHMIGFSPGFAYMGPLANRLAAPRRDTPRLAVPAGSVGITGQQTGVYPSQTPGGWQIIGRTPLELFQPARTPPALLALGDRVRFRPIDPARFGRWKVPT